MQPNDLSLCYGEALFERYRQDPALVPEDWRGYFDRLSAPGSAGGRAEDLWPAVGLASRAERAGSPAPHASPAAPTAQAAHASLAPDGPASALIGLLAAKAAGAAGASPGARVAKARTEHPPTAAAHPHDDTSPIGLAALQDRVDQLVRAYRVRGHMAARLDPLARERPRPDALDPAFYGLTERDLDRAFSVDTIPGADGTLTLRAILDRLEATYCRSIGVQFMHIDDLEPKRWLQQRMESTENRVRLARKEQLRILRRLTDAVVLEEFIQRKFIGAKSFSLEGAESLIPLLDLAIERAAAHGAREIVLAMAHRGRLNVLTNILGKSPRQLFREFEDKDGEAHRGGGDVKYHLGHSSDWVAETGEKVHLSLCFNPSHLEYVTPVALGRLRAKQDRAGDRARQHGLALIIHGDAAFAGEGVVQETLNLSELPAYTVGGAIHIILNNQIGFTTAPEEARSSAYATDVARLLQVPILHVNGEDPEAVAQVIGLALDFRAAFARDVVVDMYCYRRRGHNETDEPAFTQPLMVKAIARQPSVRDGYLDHLLRLGEVTREEADRIAAACRDDLEQSLSAARTERFRPPTDTLQGIWRPFTGGPDRDVEEADTGLAVERQRSLCEALTRVPDGFAVHPKIDALYAARRAMGRGERPFDWATAELLAFASLAVEGLRVRMSGQDSERGTFSQRHAVVHDQETGARHCPLQHLAPHAQAPVEIFNSALSEAGVLGFEYGFSLDTPDGLVIWEAQFGDFANAAQVIIDQFIASAEDKWKRLSGLVLFLPHGFEGMGPEHSSARLERFLQLGAEDNLHIVQPTTPANHFHALRRQVLRRWRKPMIVLTPKSLLRHPACVSSAQEIAEGRFVRVLEDPEPPPLGAKVGRVLLCSGKLFYDLTAKRKELGRDDVAILRLEQLYPFPDSSLRRKLARFPEQTPLYWVQEEPLNMGAWWHVRARYTERTIRAIGRPESASPATGSLAAHRLEQDELLDQAFFSKR